MDGALLGALARIFVTSEHLSPGSELLRAPAQIPMR
jgi:hypothetical protein